MENIPPSPAAFNGRTAVAYFLVLEFPHAGLIHDNANLTIF